MKYEYNDGGRAAAGYKGVTGDCGVRAVAIATGLPYQQVYDALNEVCANKRGKPFKRGVSNARTGIHGPIMRRYMASLGWKFVPTMGIGTGCKVHLRDGELPMGRILCNVSRHFIAVVDGVIQDIYDPSRNGTRCVYGYYIAA